MEDLYLIYSYSFFGSDKVENKVEIYGDDNLGNDYPEEITGSVSPFALVYDTKAKFDPICGSGATLRIINKRNFQYIRLHTIDPQKYLVRFYRDGSLYWLGWLDNELYSEVLSNAVPYPVEFTAADFNVLERIKYIDTTVGYTDIVSALDHLKRVFDKLRLPFEKLFIGCSTTISGTEISENETIFHKLYIQSSNFYDEDNEACKCDEVIKGILEPLGMIMVQLGGDVYLYDYNCIKDNIPFKSFDFKTMSFLGNKYISLDYGDIEDIGLSGTESSLTFEELINNVKITSSLYGDLGNISDEKEVTAENISTLKDTDMHYPYYMREIYGECSNWLKDYRYVKYTDFSGDRFDEDPTIVGSDVTFRDGDTSTDVLYIPMKEYIFSSETAFLKLNLKAYVNAKDNPFDDSEPAGKNDSSSKLIIKATIRTVDANGNPLQCFSFGTNPRWITYVSGPLPTIDLWFMSGDVNSQATVLNTWSSLRNSYGQPTGGGRLFLSDKEGLLIPLNGVSGNIVISLQNSSYSVFHRTRNGDYKQWGWYPFGNVFVPLSPKDLLINKFSLDIVDADGEDLKVPDVEFKSYVNANVKADFDEKKLIVCSANEDSYPVTRGSLLVKESEHVYKTHLSYIRAGQTNILERLLMCSIHSNFSSKRKTIEIDVRGCMNPSLKKIRIHRLFDSEFLTMGCEIDFAASRTKIISSEFSGDTAKLSDIKYV